MSEHRAEIRPSTRTWRVSYAGEIVLESDEVLELDEFYRDRVFPTRYYFSPAVKPLETTLKAVRACIAETRGFIEGVDRAGFEGAADRKVSIPLIDGMVIRGHDMARDFSMPNVYFHLTTAYGILRSLGVDVGKADFLGPMALEPA